VGAVWNKRGSVLLALGREKEAEESYANALRKNKESYKFGEDLGNLRSVVGCIIRVELGLGGIGHGLRCLPLV
jgi:hypothetical protein